MLFLFLLSLLEITVIGKHIFYQVRSYSKASLISHILPYFYFVLSFAGGKISRLGRPKGQSHSGASSKLKRKTKNNPPPYEKMTFIGRDLDFESDNPKFRGKRRRTKKVDSDFEYDLKDSEDEIVMKLEFSDDDDDVDADWKEESGVSDSDGVSQEVEDFRKKTKAMKVEEEENSGEAWKAKSSRGQINFFSNQQKCSEVPDSVAKKKLVENFDYKTFIDTIAWKSEASDENDDDLYGSDEAGYVEDKHIQTVGVNDLDQEKSKVLSDRIRRYVEKARNKYRREKMIKSDGKKVFRCLKCNKEFDKRMQLTEHKKVHARKLRLYECSQCGKVFHEARKYFSHLAFHERIFECITCGRKFSLLANLKKHIVIHDNAPGKVCDVCGLQFISDIELKEHYEAQHSEDNIYSYFAKCEHCGREYRREESYIQHMSRAPYKCTKCNESFNCEYERKKHIRSEHGWCVCEFCGKSFKTDSISNHIKVMHKEAPVQCPHCPKKFVYRSRMLAHIDSRHNNEKKYKCNQCSYSAKTVNSLNLHRRRCHVDPKELKWYECDICNKKFHLPSKLTVHYRAHTGEKPFACQNCGKTFACKYNKKEHERAVHGERIEVKNPEGGTLVCMVKHRRAPRTTGRRCDLCSIDFPSSTAVTEHMKKVHAPQPAESVEEEPPNAKVSVKFEPQEETGDKCLEYEVIGNSDVILSDSSSMMNIRAEEIPENATLVEINGVEYQVVRQ